MSYASASPPQTQAQAAWQAQLAAASKTPGLQADLERRRHELFPRFAAAYVQLQALPRRVRRALQCQWRLPLATLALWLALTATPVQAGTITVGGACTLVDAITAANTDTATGGCGAGRGRDTIVLPAGSLQRLTRADNNTYGPTGLPVIRSVITIVGNGSTIRRVRGEPFRILAVNSSGKLTIRETTVSGGETPEGQRGGGVANYRGTVTIFNSTISGNAAAGGGGVNNQYGPFTITNSTISGNATSGNGGGVQNFYGPLIIMNSTISGNTALQSGGGVDNASFPSTLTVMNSTISGNTALHGGGGVLNFNTVVVTNSTISANTVEFSQETLGGGGVLNLNFASLTLTNSTIFGNSALIGGGVRNFDGFLTVARTLASGNTAATGPEILNTGTVFANNYNLFGVDGTAGVVGFDPGPTDIVPPAGVVLADILEPTLADNGGPTQTHALVPGSPAIDAGGPVCLDANGNALTTDQRGQPRPVDGDGDGVVACDIGAFEVQP